MPERLAVSKTYKLFVNGRFPRSESGRSFRVEDAKGRVFAHISQASRKDLRDAVEAARAAQPAWSNAAPYLRGQILYRMAEMMEGKSTEFAGAIRATTGVSAADARREVATAVDRVVAFAGWADKFAQVLGGQNPVAGPYYNFTVPEPSGVVAILPPDRPALLGLISLLAPPLCAGNAVVAVAHRVHPVPAAILGEVCATSDVPAGVVNLLTGDRDELLPHVASHREIIAIGAANLDAEGATTLRLGAAENVKRVHVHRIDEDDWYDADGRESPWTIEPFVEMKTIWHPSAT
jgi:acyl-CoA reductase-like NAD-dependent aldehyde dehydrogenase